jgi:hypothetical protein
MSILIVPLLASLLHLAWSVHRDTSLRLYRAELVAPLTARADVQRLYRQSQFRAIEIELPQAKCMSGTSFVSGSIPKTRLKPFAKS